jgi:antitoxin (DNA-binding transcriptional repressor) of toxin-antitoxin stability system
MAVSATQLRQNIYALLDEALRTGKPIEIERKGKLLQIVPPPATPPLVEDDLSEFPRLAKLKSNSWIVGDVDDLVNVTWSSDYKTLVKKPLL